MRSWQWLLFAHLGTWPALAGSVVTVAAPEPFIEWLRQRVPVGGRNLVGVVSTPTAELPTGQGLIDNRMRLPGTIAGQVCVRARTEDGTYEAEATFDLRRAETGSVHGLKWPTEKKEALASLSLQEVAVLATAGTCGSIGGAIVPAGLADGAPVAHPFLQVLVNTRGALTWAVLRDPAVPGPALARARCIRLERGARVAYDARCLLPAPAGIVELRLEQEGRDGLSLEMVERATLTVGVAAP